MRQTTFGEYKVPGGKLVRVDIVHSQPLQCSISGDFFAGLNADTVLAEITALLNNASSDITNDRTNNTTDNVTELTANIQSILDRYPEAIAGVDAHAVVQAFLRAVQHGTVQHETVHHGTTESRMDRQQISNNETVAHWTVTPEIQQRWHRLGSELNVVIDTPHSPQEQMDIEDQWIMQVAAGQRPATLRIWNWASPAVVIGKFQAIENEVNVDAARAAGFIVVRRSTGGGAMFVRPEDTITYSLYVPAWFYEGLSTAATFRLCDSWIVYALQRLGLQAGFGGFNDIVGPLGKIGGSAERHEKLKVHSEQTNEALLHHTTLAYGFDAETMANIMHVSPEKMVDKAVKSAKKRVDPLKNHTELSREDIVTALPTLVREFC